MFSSGPSWQNRIGAIVALAAAAFVLFARFDLGAVPSLVAGALYEWALLLAGFALLLGTVNALWHHLLRVHRGQREWLFSLLLLIVFALVFGSGTISPQGTAGPLSEWVFDAVLAPGQATLYALTGIFLVSAAYHYLRFDRPGGLWMAAGALLALLVQTPYTYQLLPDGLVAVFDWLLVWPVTAALRGLLLGGALAVLFIGIRLIVRSAR